MKEGATPYSDEQAYRIAYLIAGFIRKTLTEAEHDELDAWIDASDENMRLFEDLTDEAHLEANLSWMERVQAEKRLRPVSGQLTFTPHRKPAKRRPWWPFVAAASVLLVCALLLLRPGNTPPSAPTPPQTAVAEGGIRPGTYKATLTLGDGSVLDLSAAPNGLLRQEAGTSVHKPREGVLTYTAHAGGAGGYHTLATPTGGQYALTLSDGTRVWLNAESSLRFPARFAADTRSVELTGEGYFEVAENKQSPFTVHLPEGAAIRVLGTRFNASTYRDEEAQKITLVEGSILLSAGGRRLELRPREQALVKGRSLSVQKEANLAEATGWKEGSFVFDDADIHAIMRQVKRWYNVEVVFRTQTSEHFNTTLPRNEPVSKLLHRLELTGKIHFKIENQTIYVLP